MSQRTLLAAICFLTLLATLHGDDKAVLGFITRCNPVPERRKSAPAPDPAFRRTSELSLAGEALVRLYQSFISPMDAPSCPFSPTCSEYAKRAVSQYGLVAGVAMAADRFTRCNGFSTQVYPRESGTQRLLDPP
jgi:putative membrane protein insertion efficiency factor